MHDTTLTSLVRIALKAMRHGTRRELKLADGSFYRHMVWRGTPYSSVTLNNRPDGLRMRFFDDTGGTYVFSAKSQLGGALCAVFDSCFS
jgi:hypothetical protein